VAASKTEAELTKFLGLDFLHYFSIEGMLEASVLKIRKIIFVRPALTALIRWPLIPICPNSAWANILAVVKCF